MLKLFMRKILGLLIILCLGFARDISFSGNIIANGQWDNYGQQIRLIDFQTVRSEITAVNGAFNFGNLPAGKYTLAITDKFGAERTFEYMLEDLTVPSYPAVNELLYRYDGEKNDTLSFVLLNLILTVFIFGAVLLLWRKNPTPGARQVLWLAVSFVLYTGTDFMQNILAWRGLEILAGNIFFLKHIGSAWFGYLFYSYWKAFSARQRVKYLFLLPLIESLILCSWPLFGLDSAFEQFWFFSFEQLRLVIMVQLICFLGAGVWTVFHQYAREKDPLIKNILYVTQYVFSLLVLLLFSLVFVPLVLRRGAEFFDQQYILTALVFGLILFGWLASTEIYRQLFQLQLKLERQERLSALGTLASGLAHEIKNPLAAISNLIQLLPKSYKSKEFRQKFTDIVPRQIAKINALLSELLELGRPAKNKKQNLYLDILLDRTVGLLQTQAKKQKVYIAAELERKLKYRGDILRLEQGFLNLGLNALQAMPRGGTLTIRSYKNAKKIIVIFQDTGAGFSPEIIPHIFDPFFTTKKSGSGLGLSVTKKILDEHNVKIEITAAKGARIKLIF